MTSSATAELDRPSRVACSDFRCLSGVFQYHVHGLGGGDGIGDTDGLLVDAGTAAMG
jgi:hypothetical protein